MNFEGIGTTQDYQLSLKYTWLCSLNGNKKCINKIDRVLNKLNEDTIIIVKSEIDEMLEKQYIDGSDEYAAFKLAYWYEKSSPEIDLEKSLNNPNYLRIRGRTYLEDKSLKKDLIGTADIRNLTSGLAVIYKTKDGFLGVADTRRDGTVMGN